MQWRDVHPQAPPGQPVFRKSRDICSRERTVKRRGLVKSVADLYTKAVARPSALGEPMNLQYLLAAALLLVTPAALAQDQASDPDFRPDVPRPAYAGTADAPRVAIDGSHANFHTIDGRYAPFAALLRADGYRVEPIAALERNTLGGIGVLVIANARRPFAAGEIEAIAGWVAEGGALLLIADHAPFGRIATPLAQRFGVDMGQGYVVTGEGAERRVTGKIEFAGRRLADHPILSGRDEAEKVRRVKSFTGQSLGVPGGATALLRLPRDAFEVPSAIEVRGLQRGESVKGRNVGTRAQGVALTHGKGRIVVLGEAAMLSAQIAANGERMGMNAPGSDDRQFALNILHWLSGLTGS